MSKKNPQVDDYIEKASEFARPILKHLRKLVHQACPQVEETLKWKQPFFLHHGILAVMSGFKAHCNFGCWNDKLIGDEVKGLGKAGHGFHTRMGRITKLADLPADRVLLAYIKAGARLNEAGVKVLRGATKKKAPLKVPDYLAAALKKNKKALAVFENFSPSHQREYVEWIVDAKAEETRQRRIKQALKWMAEGKPRNWKYMNC